MDDLVLSDEDDSADDIEDMLGLENTQKDSATHKIYMKLMKDPKFNLTFQPKLIEEGPSLKHQAAEAEQSHNVVEEIDLQSLLKSATLKNKDLIGMKQQEQQLLNDGNHDFRDEFGQQNDHCLDQDQITHREQHSQRGLVKEEKKVQVNPYMDDAGDADSQITIEIPDQEIPSYKSHTSPRKIGQQDMDTARGDEYKPDRMKTNLALARDSRTKIENIDLTKSQKIELQEQMLSKTQQAKKLYELVHRD